MDSRTALRARRAPRRVSQDPSSLCRRAPSPIAPGSPRDADARCFSLGSRLRHIRKSGRCQWCNEAESGSRTLGSRLRSRDRSCRAPGCIARPDRPVSRRWSPADAGPELHGERAIHMADTSQSARVMWVTLAQPEYTDQDGRVGSGCQRALREARPPAGSRSSREYANTSRHQTRSACVRVLT